VSEYLSDRFGQATGPGQAVRGHDGQAARREPPRGFGQGIGNGHAERNRLLDRWQRPTEVVSLAHGLPEMLVIDDHDDHVYDSAKTPDVTLTGPVLRQTDVAGMKSLNGAPAAAYFHLHLTG